MLEWHRQTLAELLDRCLLLLLKHSCCPLLFSPVDQKLVLVSIWILCIDILGVGSFHIPGQVAPSHEVEQDDAQGLEVITARMLVAFVAAEGQILGCADDTFFLLEGDMDSSLGAKIALS